jgi:acyl carrier protein
MEQKFLASVKEVLEIEDRDLKLSDNFKEFKEWDSLANLTMVAMLDDEFGVVIDSQRLKKWQPYKMFLTPCKKYDSIK